MAQHVGRNDSLEAVLTCLRTKQSFLLEAGAGSGKTWTLVEALKFLLAEKASALTKANQRIACITYTNAAKDEIAARIDNDPLVVVNTIHEFLWGIISNYQAELKQEILTYNTAKLREPIDDLETKIRHLPVEYSQYGRSFAQAQIHHEDVLAFSANLFERFPKIARIAASKYPYVFVDEYQDTEKRTVDLLIDRLLGANLGKLVLGFFGDSMQKIYNQGIGVIQSEHLQTITKHENFRCSLEVITLLNAIRPGLQQVPAGHNLPGQLSFYSANATLTSDQQYVLVYEHLRADKGWLPADTKVLMLTHRSIGVKLEYTALLVAYEKLTFGRERLFKSEDVFSSLFEKIENLVALYDQKKYGDFIQLFGREGLRFSSHNHKEDIKSQMDRLNVLRETATVKDVLNYALEQKLLTKPQRLCDFEVTIAASSLAEDAATKRDFCEALFAVSYSEVVNVYRFINEQTPFSTKHGVKGEEYENVLIVIDDAAWNQYNFNHVFSNNHSNPARYERTLNLFYVCCSRAKNRLAVLVLSPLDPPAMQMLTGLFGIDITASA